MKFKEIVNLSESELLLKLAEMREQVLKLRREIALSQEKQTHKLRVAKKDIARILTLIKQKASK